MNAVSVVGTLKLYHMLKNLFELIAIKGINGDRKTLGTSAHARVQGLGLAPTVNAYPRAHEPPDLTTLPNVLASDYLLQSFNFNVVQ